MATAEEVQNAVGTAMAAAVSVKLPPFWADKTGLWFAQAEAQFTIKNITTEKTKYAYVVTMLDSQTAAQAMDIIRTPPEALYTAHVAGAGAIPLGIGPDIRGGEILKPTLI